MKNVMRLLLLVAFSVLFSVTTYGQSQEGLLSGYRYAVIPLQTFDDGKVDPYGLAKEIKQRLAADTSWQVLTDVQVTTGRGAPAKLPWETVASSDFIAKDRIKLAQTVSLSIYTTGGRGRIDVWIVASDILGQELARFKGTSGRTGRPGARMRGAVQEAITALTQQRPEFKPNFLKDNSYGQGRAR